MKNHIALVLIALAIALPAAAEKSCMQKIDDQLAVKDHPLRDAYHLGQEGWLAPEFMRNPLSFISAPFLAIGIEKDNLEYRHDLNESKEALEALAQLEAGQEVTSPALLKLTQLLVNYATDEVIIDRLEKLSATNELCSRGLTITAFAEVAAQSFRH